MLSPRRQNALSAPAAYLMQEGVAALALALAFTVQAVYFVQGLGLSPFQLVLVGTVLELTCFLFEIPTGVVADVYSRRLSVILGFLGLGLSFVVIALVPTFAGVLAAQVVAGLGYTFLSGAQAAWLTDEVGEDRVGALFVRGAQAAAVGGIAGTLLSAGLGSVNLLLPIGVGAAVLGGLALGLALTMPERGFTPPPRGERSLWNAQGWRALGATFGDGVRVVRSRPVLRGLLAVALLFGASTEALDRLWQYHLLETFTLPRRWGLTDAAWFGLIALAGQLLGLLVTEGLRRRLHVGTAPQAARWLARLTALGILAGLVFALAGQFWLALGAFLAGGVLRGLYGPVYAAWLNQGLDSRVRATVISIASQADALGQVAGGPAVGYLGTVSGVRVALAATALLRVPMLWLFLRSGSAPRGGPAPLSAEERAAG